jgi:pyruvate/2-oxoglutarate dehydrogenase complex dihydrolipoamide acyltransferase (E2) component
MIEPPKYREAPWPPIRNAVVGYLRQHRPHTNYGTIEVDITDALAAMERYRREFRTGLSLHAFVLYCMAHAAAENPAVLTYRSGRDRLVTFEDADIGTIIEKRLPGGHIRVPVGYVFRAAQRKSLSEINEELRTACRSELADDPAVRWRRRIARVPEIIRRAVFHRVFNDPFLLRRFYGNIGLTNVQTPGFHNPLFIFPPNVHTLTFGIGNTTERWGAPVEGEPTRRKVLCLGGGADHAVIDGMGLARFAHRFTHLLESAAGLDDAFAAANRRATPVAVGAEEPDA